MQPHAATSDGMRQMQITLRRVFKMKTIELSRADKTKVLALKAKVLKDKMLKPTLYQAPSFGLELLNLVL